MHMPGTLRVEAQPPRRSRTAGAHGAGEGALKGKLLAPLSILYAMGEEA